MSPDRRDAAKSKARVNQKRKRPRVGTPEDLPHDEPKNWDEEHPVFCLRHIHADHDLKHSDFQAASKAAFATRLQALASMTWKDIRRQDRHRYGTERLPVSMLRITLPGAFEGEESVLVFRYDSLKPMVGIRRNGTFHILAIEREFGELYNHGD